MIEPGVHLGVDQRDKLLTVLRIKVLLLVYREGEGEGEIPWAMEVEDELVGVDGVRRRCAVQWRPSEMRSAVRCGGPVGIPPLLHSGIGPITSGGGRVGTRPFLGVRAPVAPTPYL